MNAHTSRSQHACLECHRVCLETITYLQASGRPVDPADVRLLFNCAELCRTGASLLRGAADLHARACVACADVCERSAEYCERFPDDPVMRACAEACRRCAAYCHQAAAMAA